MARTSSLNRVRSGSMSWNLMSRQAAHIVVRFDVGRAIAAAGLYDVRYSVPCTRNLTSLPEAPASSMT